MVEISVEELLNKTKIENKYILTRLAIKKAKELIKEKDKRVLQDFNKNLTTLVLKELLEGKIKDLKNLTKEN
ncbi:DNA-directed RNA polymerase subunit omega [Candidatus Aerophobetes bacterium]|nr:DNA-directed RNA polymerase subunit omega [Candidatus Aerophobetes bacterium]